MAHQDKATVFVIKPCVTDLVAFEEHFFSVHINAEYFFSADEALEHINHRQRGCIILDAGLSGANGVGFLERLREKRIKLPVILLGRRGDVAGAVHALKNGAADFLEKPVRGQALLDAVQDAIETDRLNEQRRRTDQRLRMRLNSLTPREWEVLFPMVRGCSNMEIAKALELSPRTVEVYRARIMQKTGVTTLAELIRLVIRLGLLDQDDSAAPQPDAEKPASRGEYP
jgi:two-component system, LuxR family, response regulator FixJ